MRWPTATATMNEALMLEYIDKILMKICNQNDSLLLLDEFSAHKTDHVIKKLIDVNINPVFVPGGFTSLLQPLDVAINKPLKMHIRSAEMNGSQKTRLQTKTIHENAVIAKDPNGLRFFKWISESLNCLNKDTIYRSFECTGLKKGNWLDFKHLSANIRNLLVDDDDWDESDRLIAKYNEEIQPSYNSQEILNINIEINAVLDELD